jgi:hypothetical protein
MLVRSIDDAATVAKPTILVSFDRNVCNREVKFELVLSGVVFEESVDIGLPTREAAAVVSASEWSNFDGLSHSSAREARGSNPVVFRFAQ